MVMTERKKKSKKLIASPRKATWRPVGGVFEIVAAKPLLVRLGSSLTSPEVSRLGGQRVIVLETLELVEEGVTRARIALEGQQLDYGWITSVGRDGTPQLRSMAPPSAAAKLITSRAAAESASMSSSSPLSAAAVKARFPSSSRKTAGNAAASKKSNRDRRQSTVQTTRASLRVELSLIAEPLEQSSTSLYAAAEVLVQQAEEIEALDLSALTKGVPLLKVQLGEALHKRAVTADKSRDKMFELLELFGDRNGDSKVSKMEFRGGVRSILGGEVNIKDVDSLFGQLDTDSSGNIDPEELLDALNSLKVAAESLAAADNASKSKGTVQRERAAQVREAAHSAKASEEADAALKAAIQARTPEARLGTVLMTRNVKADIMCASRPLEC